jgi:hypothetical protein
MKKFRLNIMLLIFTGILFAGCSTAPVTDENAFAAPMHLTATLATPIDIDLNWQDNAANAAGYFVEYSPQANDEFVIITALPPDSTKYRHPHLLPHTEFVFRVVPFFGPASKSAGIKTGKAGPQQSPAASEIAETNSPDIGTKNSIRSMSTFAEGAPTDFRATLIPPAGVKLDWVDHASDAEGYLIEIKAEWSSNFLVSAILPPHTTSLTSYGLPPETRFDFRVRPFFYGKPSNTAAQTTGDDPSRHSGPWIKVGSP